MISRARLALLPLSVRCVPYYMSFSVQILCSGMRWLTSLVGTSATYNACPKCRQTAKVVGSSLRGLLSSLEI